VKIKDLKSTIVSIPFAKPTLWPYGRWDGMTVVVIEIETDQGIIGLGESICIQSSAEAVKLFIDNTKPYLLDQDPFDTERIGKQIEGLGGWTFGRHFAGYALAGIDMALWDIIGKACNQPVYKLLGGRHHQRRASDDMGNYGHKKGGGGGRGSGDARDHALVCRTRRGSSSVSACDRFHCQFYSSQSMHV
jgi:L-alanine-DL-glutamate epimerase-like enolase superfamily enzyme